MGYPGLLTSAVASEAVFMMRRDFLNLLAAAMLLAPALPPAQAAAATYVVAQLPPDASDAKPGQRPFARKELLSPRRSARGAPGRRDTVASSDAARSCVLVNC